MKKKRTGSGASPRATAKQSAKRFSNPAESGATVDRIIESARQVLLQYGHASFTTRRVAEVAGMTHGNLNYHFPSKRDLLRALIAHLVKTYAQRFEAFLAEPNYPVGHDLERLARWLWTDSISSETVRTFRELWALSLHDPVICRAVDDFYDEALAGVSQMVRDRRPKADAATIDLLVTLLGLISEGSTVIYGTRPRRIVAHAQILDLIPRLIGLIVPELQRPPGESGVAPAPPSAVKS